MMCNAISWDQVTSVPAQAAQAAGRVDTNFRR
jgi:hypothetical protein